MEIKLRPTPTPTPAAQVDLPPRKIVVDDAHSKGVNTKKKKTSSPPPQASPTPK